MPIPNIPSVATLKRAIEVAERIEKLEGELASILGQPAAARPASTPVSKTATVATPVRKRGKISPEGIARIKAAQKARWAKAKALQAPWTPAAQPARFGRRAKRNVSPEARAKMAAAARRRWAQWKKAR